jgi:hypothetical protein
MQCYPGSQGRTQPLVSALYLAYNQHYVNSLRVYALVMQQGRINAYTLGIGGF